MTYGHLGQETIYAEHYNPALLFPIARSQGRAEIGNELPSFFGADVWHGYELSWLDERGKPVVACARFVIPCHSPFLIESKSFKLYLNSFNQTRYADMDSVTMHLTQDLSKACGAEVQVTVLPLATQVGQVWQTLEGICVDDLSIDIDCYTYLSAALRTEDTIVTEQLVSHLLKSNCPVTNQPDWASVQVAYHGPKINKESLLRTIVSLRQHQGFHEQCVEQLFCAITDQCQPESLSVLACYTRRGGLDINPYRSSHDGALPDWGRIVRQ